MAGGPGREARHAADIRRKVVTSRGEHEFEARSLSCGTCRTSRPGSWPPASCTRSTRTMRGWRSSMPARSTPPGTRPRPSSVYREALAGGLREPHRHRARIQLASSLRISGGAEEAYALLSELADERPHSVAVVAFRALARSTAVEAARRSPTSWTPCVHHAGDEDTLAYGRALHAYAADLRHR